MATRSKYGMLRVSKLALAVSLAFNGAAQAALPTGAQVASGSAQIGTVGSTMTVTNSPSAIINWQSFSIGQSEAVKFVQQSASSSVLNRVVGGQMSAIMGRLNSNGRVFLINPAGVLVGAGAVVDTASFFASTLQILDKDFLAGKLQFQGDADSGKITNQGLIRTGYGGQVVLLAPNIENSGIIQAPGGKILLAAGQKVTLGSLDMDGLSFQVQAPTDSALNLGQLIADGGVVKVFAGSLKHSGDIRANSLTRDSGGEIVLKARGDVELTAGSTTVANGRTGGTIRIESETGTARVAGDVSATGRTGTGGAIDVLGEKVVLTGNATLDGSGATAGGLIRVGGDWQGANPDVKNAQTAFVGSGVTLKADATEQGDGGKIVVWSDGDTRFLGSLSAQGGPNGGNGGSAEVSGKGGLLFIGGANLGAPKGTAGSLLLDPLDLFVDLVGGLNPSIIDETTDFPNNAVTVSPATLAAIVGNVTLYASRDMRLNSAIALAGAGQGLAANAGRDLQMGAGITTNGGALSLSAGRTLNVFNGSALSTAGGSVTLGAQNFVNGSLISVAAGTGNLSASTSAGTLQLGTISSAGTVNLSASGGNLGLSNITSTGAVTLSGSSQVSANAIATGGAVVAANAVGSNVSINSIDTRAGGGPTGAAVSLSSTSSSVNTGAIQTGNAAVVLSGTSISTGTITTTANVGLTATAGNVNSTVNDAANVTASAVRNDNGNVRVDLSSTSATTPLNAASASATTAFCSAVNNCRSATVTLSGQQGVNVGTVSASAPATSNVAAPFNSKSESVSISSTNGSIRAMGGGGQVTATDVTLSTTQGTGGGIGIAGAPISVNNARTFTFNPNGEFNVALTGSGPNRLTANVGVAATGSTYNGTLTKAGQINLDVSANDTTVTANTFSISGGFDDLVFNQSPLISLRTPNGALTATNVSMPAGDVTGRIPPFCCAGLTYQPLPVTLRASGDLVVSNYTRAAGSRAKSTTFQSDSGSMTLGTVSGNLDSMTVSASIDATITSLSTAGFVQINASTGNIAVNSVTSSGSGVTMNANNGVIGAINDGPGVEITASGAVNLSANRIGTAGFTNPLDIAGNSVSLTTTGAGTYIGSGTPPNNAVTAATTALTINAAGQYNVTSPVDLTNLTVTAIPSGVGAGGIARVTSSATQYNATSDGTNFTLANWTAPAAQFAGGTLDFTSTAGNVTLANIDFSASNGSLSVRTSQLVTGNITQTGGSTLNLGSGFLTLRADNNVMLDNVTAGGMAVSSANGEVYSPAYSPGGCEYIGYSYICAPNLFAAGNISDPTGGGSFSATARHGITTGNLAVGNVSFSAYNGGITVGAIGSGATPANSIYLDTNTSGVGGSVQTGAIEANSTTIYSDAAITVGSLITPAAVNAANTGAGSVYFYTSDGNITAGSIDANSVRLDANGSGAAGSVTIGTLGVPANINASAATTFPNNINIYANTSVSVGTLDADQITISGHCCQTYPSIVTGTIGGVRPGNYVDFSGASISIGGGLNLDAAGTGQTLRIGSLGNIAVTGNVTTGQGGDAFNPMYLDAGNLLTINAGNGVVSAADGAFLRLRAGNGNTASPFQFAGIGAGATGGVTVQAPAGIIQTQSGATGGGIRAASVTLNADSAGSAIDGPPSEALVVRGATSLTLTSAGSVNIDRTDGVNPIPALNRLDISRSDSAAAFALTGFSAGQSATVINVAGGVQVAAATPDGTPMNFRYQNGDAAGSTITGTGIASKGGEVILDSSSGTVNTGIINTTDPSVAGSGNTINLSAGGAGVLNVSGALNAGSGTAILQGPSVSGGGTVTSTTQVQVTSFAGDIGISGTHLAIAAPDVQLASTGESFAALTGTSTLQLAADTGFTVASSTALTNLGITTRGDRGGPVVLAAAGQSYGFARNGGSVDITTVSSPAPLSSFGFSVSNGGLRAIGTGVSSISADSLTLFASGNLTLDGSGARLVLSSASFQDFAASGNVNLNGAATISSLGIQRFRANGDTVLQAQAGNQVINGVDQTFSAGQDLKLLGGTTAGDSVAVAATGSQSFSANRHLVVAGGDGSASSVSVSLNGNGSQSLSTSGGGNGNLSLTAGAGAGAAVTVSSSGAGSQYLYADGNLTLGGGGVLATTADAAVAVTKAGSNAQTLDAGGSIILNGGPGDRGSVQIANTGSGQQTLGESYCCSNPTDNVTLQGGAGADSFALITTVGRQQIQPVGALSVIGGGGTGAYARINTDSTISSGTSISGGPQIIGYNSAYDCCSGNQIQTIAVAAGTGSGAFAEISSAGSQRIAASVSMILTGSATDGVFARVTALSQDIRTATTTLTAGAGNGANASIEATGIEANRPNGSSYLQLLGLSGLSLSGGGTVGANAATARILSGGTQRVSSSPTSLLGGVGPNSSAEIVATTSQSLVLGNLTMTAGGGNSSSANILAGTTQSLSASNTSLTGGGGQNAKARIEADTQNSLSFNNLTLTGGTSQGAQALIIADSGQTLFANATQLIGGTGTAAGDASALISNDHGDQSISPGSLTIRSGADFATAGIVAYGLSQNVTAGGALTITTTAGANNLNGASGPLGSGYYSGILFSGSGAQAISASSINVNNQHAPGPVGIKAPATQTITAFGPVTVQTSAGDARISTGGTQTIGASGVVTVQVNAAAATASIDAVTGTQTIRGTSASTADPGSANAGQVANAGSASGGVRVQVSGGSGGTARIANSGGGQNIIGSFVDVNTSAVGTAAVTASGDQWIHTTNGGASGVGSLRVAAVGGGSATVSSGGDQLLQIDYPELMQANRNGSITVGSAGATGSSLISAVNQDVFARSITVLGGATASADSKIDVTGVQNISLVSSTATPSAGITVTAGAGGTALIDPVTQTILSNGPISVSGGSALDTVGGIVGTGDQTILVTSGGPNSIVVQGGSGDNAFGEIITSGAIQRIGTSGEIVLIGGSGTNADAIIGANGGTAETFLACGTGFVCNAGLPPFTAIPSVNNPFTNGTTDVGVYYSPITVPLDDIIAATGGGVPQESSTITLPGSLFNSVILWAPELPLTDEEREKIVLGRRLPVCN